jgi:osmoprotectant transport system ATP-binding protein
LIRFENVSMSYGTNEVIQNLSFTIEEGQLAVFIGPSGCGKTTTLQLINRLLNPTSGKIYINGADIQTMDPVQLRRKIGYVIQEIGLFPHMTIEQNIEIVPKLLKWPAEKRRARTLELLKLVDLDPEKYLKRHPSKLSGGQQQRIGLLRALAAEPPIILMDEPFGALDPITREALQDEIKQLQKKLKKTIIFVTHDMDEAIKIADVIILMKDGAIVQQASPEKLLSEPANEFVEKFIGKRRMYNGRADKVSDIMNKRAFAVPGSMGIAQSIALMEHNNVSGILVTDENDRLLGYLGIETIANKAKAGQTLADLEINPLPVIRPDSDAKEAFELLIDKKYDLLAVVDDNNHVLGVVSKTSMVRSLASVVWNKEAANV